MRKRMNQLRMRLAMLALLVGLTIPGWAAVTGTYDSDTQTLTFSGTGALTRYVVTAVTGYDQASTYVIGGDVSNIEASALKYLTNIKTLVFSAGSTKLQIAYDALQGDEIKSFVCERQFNYAFEAWTSGGLFIRMNTLRSVTIGAAVEYIPISTFYACTALNSVDLSRATSLKGIGSNAFAACSALASIDLPEGLKTIQYEAFTHCTRLESITIPGSVTSIGEKCFQQCDNISTVTFASGADTLYVDNYAMPKKAVNFNCDRTVYATPNDDFWGGSYGLFYGSRLQNVTMGPCVKYIDSYEFRNCPDLTHVDLSRATSLKSIWGYAFQECPSLTTIQLPEGLERIGVHAFYLCKQLKSISIPGSVQNISMAAFSRCKSLSSLTFEDGVDSLEIGQEAFDSTAVEQLYLGRNFSYKGNAAYLPDMDGLGFPWKASLEKVTIGKYVTGIPDYTFAWNFNLENVVINSALLAGKNYTEGRSNLQTHFQYVVRLTFDDNVTYIGDYAFAGSKLLCQVNLANTTTNVSPTAFKDCPKLNDMKSETWFDDGFYYCYFSGDKRLVIWPADEDAEVAIPDYAQYNVGNAAPWREYADEAERLVLKGNITSIGSNAFRNFSQLRSVTFQDAILTSIKGSAFSDCTNLQNFAFPSTLEEIESSAFGGCESLENINLKNTSLATLGSGAFRGCSALKTVLLPSTCNTIGDEAFNYCKKVKEVACYSWPTSVGTQVFDADIKNNNSLLFYEPRSGETHPLASYFTTTMSASIYRGCGPSMLYSISGGVLTLTSSASEPVSTYDYEKSAYVPWADKASTITQVVVTGPVSRIGSHLFADLPNLTSVDLINTTGLTEIGDHAFEGCAALETFKRPTTIQTFDEYAFYGCSSLDRQLPSDLTTLGMMALAYSGITSANIPNGVTVIGDDAFLGCTNLTSVTFPRGLKKIGYYAFGDCTALTSIDLPEGYTVIDGSAFPGSGLTSLTLKSSVVEIQENAFGGCHQLAEVITYGDSKLERIGRLAFCGDDNLRRFVMPGRVRVIEGQAFEDCALEAVELSNTLIDLGDKAFSGCHLTTVEIPTSLSVLSSAFSENALLEKVTVPNNIKKINDYAFYNCSSLSSVILPDSLTYLGSEAFEYCTQLSSIRIPEGISDIYGYTFRGSGLTTVDVPATVKTIGWDAFKGCSNLISVTLPEGLKAIEGEAFQNCTSLTEITLPDSLETIGQNAFAGCSSLQSIFAMPVQAPTVENRNAFDESVYSSTSETIVYTANVGNYNWHYPWSEMNLQNPYEGYAGDNVKYSLEGIQGGYALKLTTEGDGPEYVIYDGMEGELPGWIYPLTRFVPQIIRIDMDEKLTGIGDYSLACLSAVQTLHIPAAVTTIGTGAFAGMTSLEEIFLANPTPTTSGTGVADDDVYARAMVYSAEPNAYKTSTIWKKFAADHILPYITGWCGRIYTDEEWAEMSSDEFINEKNGGSIKYTLKGHELLIAENLSTYDWIIGITDLEMQDYASSSAVPWIKYRDYITDVKFDFYNGRLSRIGDYAFYYLTKVEHIDLPSLLWSIGNYAFYNSGLQSVTFPTGLNTIGNKAFYNTKLQSVEVPGNVASMGMYEFGANSNLESITFYDGVTKIPSLALGNCPNLVTVNIPNTVTTIDPSFLKNCTSITSVYIPNSVTSLSGNAFEGCTSLVDVHLPECKLIGYGYSLFKGCTSLQSVEIPSQWTMITSNFFEGCTALESITLPQAISSIGKEAFKGCTSLKTIQVERTTPVTLTEQNSPFADWTLGDDGKYDATLIVPQGTAEAYAAAAVWQNFHIQEQGIFNLTDGQLYANTVEQEADRISYTRSFSDRVVGNWQCLYVPFDITVTDELHNDFDFAQLYMISYKDADGDGVIKPGDDPLVMLVSKFECGETLYANTPYYIRVKSAGTKTILVEDAMLMPAEANTITCSTTSESYTLTGTYEPTDMLNRYTMATSGQFTYITNEGTLLKPNRWYMEVHGHGAYHAPIQVLTLGEDDTTGIIDMPVDQRAGIYTIDGRKVSDSERLGRGIYIINGKKMFKK